MSELQQQLNVETIAATPEFDQHLELAIEACLNDRNNYLQHLERLQQEYQGISYTNVAHHIGAWGIRELVESLTGDFTEEIRTERPPKEDILLTSAEVDVQLKIEAFGAAILDEAFLCLGEDAVEEVEEYKAAKTHKEKRNAYNWLFKRLENITRISRGEPEYVDGAEDEQAPDTSEESEDSMPEEDNPSEEELPNNNGYIYNPAYFSPKLIGRYPDIKLTPSCLGMSILASSFLHKAGEDYLHAGVVHTASSEVRVVEGAMISQLKDFAQACGIKIPDQVEERLDKIHEEQRTSLGTDRGFHATVISKLFNQDWVQIDPYFASNLVLPRKGSIAISEYHQRLKSMGQTAKGLESFVFNRDSLSPFSFYFHLEDLMEASKPLEYYEEFLQNLPEDTALSEIFTEAFSNISNPKTRNGKKSVLQLEYLFEYVYDEDYHEDFQAILQGTIDDFLFKDAKEKGLDWCVQRCKTDKNYLRRRAEDLKLLPLYGLIRSFGYLEAAIVTNSLRLPHSVYEAGLPEYRVGICALSDLATYCKDDLPPSFWLTYWQSHVSLAEHHENTNGSKAQQRMVQQVADYMERSGWTYHTNRGIINDILEQEKDGA